MNIEIIERMLQGRVARLLGIACLAGAAALVTACGKREGEVPSGPGAGSAPVVPITGSGGGYSATLEDGIQFNRDGWPDFVASVSGLSGKERWGRWSDGERVSIRFRKPLPAKFVMEITGGAFGPNLGRPAKVTIGGFATTVKFSGVPYAKEPETRRIEVSVAPGTDTLEFAIPQPAAPGGGDNRKLGIGFVRLRVIEGK
jgi:hypothetical protein